MNQDQPNYMIHNPGNTGGEVDSIYCILSVDEEGNEGMVGLNGMPFVLTEKDAFDRMLPMVRGVLKSQGVTGRIVKFTKREEIEEL